MSRRRRWALPLHPPRGGGPAGLLGYNSFSIRRDPRAGQHAAPRPPRLRRPAARLPMTLRPFPFLPTARRALRPLLVVLALVLGAAAAQADEYGEVQALQRAGQTSEALARADRHIAAHPNDPQMRFVKANLLSAGGRAGEAETLLVQLTRDYPELPEPWNNLAVLYAGRGQLDQAQQALEAALRVNPAYATALENLGDVRLRQASEAYQRARQLDPGSATRLTPRIDALRGLLGSGATR